MIWFAQEKYILKRRVSYAKGGNCLAIWEDGDCIHLECMNMEVAG